MTARKKDVVGNFGVATVENIHGDDREIRMPSFKFCFLDEKDHIRYAMIDSCPEHELGRHAIQLLEADGGWANCVEVWRGDQRLVRIVRT